MDVRLQIPDDVARVIQGQQPDLSRAALEALALEGYRSERLSEGQVPRHGGNLLSLHIRQLQHATCSQVHWVEEPWPICQQWNGPPALVEDRAFMASE
jgi:hypothetical protein